MRVRPRVDHRACREPRRPPDRDLAVHRDRRLSDQAEERAQRLVAISFFLLAPYVAQDALRTLIAGDHPSISWVGIGLSISSLVLMPLLGRAKQRIGSQLGSGRDRR